MVFDCSVSTFLLLRLVCFNIEGIELFWDSHTYLKWADIPNRVQFRKDKISASKATEIKEKSKKSL